MAAYGTAFEITGGTIRGDVYSGINMTLSGAPVINSYDYEGLTLKAGKYVKIDGLTQGADIILQGDGAMTKAADSPNVSQYLENGYIKPATRFALKVTDTEHLKRAIRDVKRYDAEGRFNRKPIMWELWQVITGCQLNRIDYSSYVPINDYTCDIDYPDEAELFNKLV